MQYIFPSIKVGACRLNLNIAVLLLILSALLLLQSCAVNEEREYRDFISEMDILTRLDICFRDVMLNNALFYTKRELNYLKADMLMWSGNLEEAANVNGLFAETADFLLQSILGREAGDAQSADFNYGMAQARYIDAKSQLYRIIPEGKNV